MVGELCGLKIKEEGRAPTTAVTILVIGTGLGGEVEATAIEGVGLPTIADGTNPPENRPMDIKCSLAGDAGVASESGPFICSESLPVVPVKLVPGQNMWTCRNS